MNGLEVKTVNIPEVKTVNIPIEEYFELRTKAEMNGHLIQQVGQLEGRFFDLDRRIYELECKLKEVLKDERVDKR